MPEILEELYPQIGRTIADIIPEEWKSVWVIADVKPGVISLKGYYCAEADGVEHGLRVNRQLVKLFNQLHVRMVDELHDDWKTARFTMERSGQFNMEFRY